MKQTTLVLIAVVILTSCTEKHRVVIVNDDCQTQDVITVKTSKPKTLIIDQPTLCLINSFRPPIRDAAYFFLTHKESIREDRFHFICGKFEFWRANGYDHFKLDSPIEMQLTSKEKRFFWNMYNEYKTDQRMWDYESKVEIIITD